MVSVVETSYKTAAAPVLSLMCDPSVKHAIWKGLRCWRCCLRSLIVIRVSSATVVLNLGAMRVVEVVMSHVFPSSGFLS